MLGSKVFSYSCRRGRSVRDKPETAVVQNPLATSSCNLFLVLVCDSSDVKKCLHAQSHKQAKVDSIKGHCKPQVSAMTHAQERLFLEKGSSPGLVPSEYNTHLENSQAWLVGREGTWGLAALTGITMAGSGLEGR